jgi:hypothetical protein
MSSQISDDADRPARPARPARSLRRTMAAAVLAFEGLTVFFAALVAKDLSSLSVGQALGFGSALAVACLIGAGLLRSPVGFVLGWVLQVLVLGTGVWVPMMFFLGAVFAALWFTALRVGGRIDQEKAAYAAAQSAARSGADG